MNQVGGWPFNSQPPATEPCAPDWYTAPPLFMPLQTCGSKRNRTGIQPSQAAHLRGLFAVWDWMLSASIPFRNWQECPHSCWRFPASAGFSILCGLASISSKTLCGYVCASIYRYFGDMFPCLPACSRSPSQLQIFWLNEKVCMLACAFPLSAVHRGAGCRNNDRNLPLSDKLLFRIDN